MKMFTAPKLKVGDTIGIFCASHIYTDQWYAQALWTLERLGFKVKVGKNARLDTYGYAASAEERAADINALVADDEVKMLLFGGGGGAAEIYIKRNRVFIEIFWQKIKLKIIKTSK